MNSLILSQLIVKQQELAEELKTQIIEENEPNNGLVQADVIKANEILCDRFSSIYFKSLNYIDNLPSADRKAVSF